MYNKKCEAYWLESDYLPLDAILEYWCGKNYECRTAKEFAIIAALEKGEIEFSRTDRKTFNDPVQELIGRNILVIHRRSFERWAKKIDEANKPNLPLNIRSEKSYLYTIGALLEVITGTFRGEQFSSETQLREFIAEKFDDLRGVKPRNTADIFAAAKKALNSDPG